jgi:pilus assembly protein Flp/PilA
MELSGRRFEQSSGSKEPHMKTLFSRFMHDECGATAIEYGLIAAGIAVVIITAVQLVGTNLQGTFNNVRGRVGRSFKAPLLSHRSMDQSQ